MNEARAPRAEAVIDLGAIRHNVALLSGKAAESGAATMAVVKGDGYGHGALPVAKAALAGGATWLGGCSLDEALALRRAGITARILTWLDTDDVDFAPGIEADIDITASSRRELGRIVAAARAIGRAARVHLKIDTGLCRNGCPDYEWPGLCADAAEADSAGTIDVVAIWSHFACADELGHPSINAQAKRFDEAYQIAREAGLNPLRHLANSAATLTRPEFHFDLVRTGIAIYGCNPVPTDDDLVPAMTFRSAVALVKRAKAGESVSYGQIWTAERETTLALVPVGYADGVPRTLSGRMDVWLDGQRRPIVGRVCMDQLVVDCGDHEPEVGAEVVLFGTGRGGEPTAREWADIIGTIDYEIVTGMYRPRVVRRYVAEVTP
ncbi:alanine racemase [Haloechinothrix halophila]|uniref:Alanine racemase n=1 Tax=Haloechinothrix halophila YIM 93223 TaxID=592678 RepID=W9DSA9_9PSEU|nr:alanine racemase [Haloechinothrix halophila]ETA66351.1 alanine racemase [Haloechinothrix halophila YIM 93223]